MDPKKQLKNESTTIRYRKEKCKKFYFLAMTTIPLLPILRLRLLPNPRLPQTPFRFTSAFSLVV
jgi:hypothetical protein